MQFLKIKIPVINGLGHQHFGNHESWFDTFLKKLLPNIEGGVVDVGVNIGQTLIKIASIDKTIPYIGFEPNPFVFCYSYKLIEANNLTNYKLFYTGLFTHEEILTLHMDNYLSSGASVLPNIRENMNRFKRKMNVPVFAGDTIFSKLNFKAGLLKIDVEGAELEVLKGLTQFLIDNQPIIVLEILPVYTLEKENGRYRKERELELISFLNGLNYVMFRIDENTIKLTELTEIPVHNQMSQTNYLFTPKNKKQKIQAIF